MNFKAAFKQRCFQISDEKEFPVWDTKDTGMTMMVMVSMYRNMSLAFMLYCIF